MRWVKRQPTLNMLGPPYTDGTRHGFSTNLENLFVDDSTAAIHTWVYGHTHFNADQIIEGVRVCSNQRGYPGQESKTYRPNYVVEVPADGAVE